jgi:hypothetical protein
VGDNGGINLGGGGGGGGEVYTGGTGGSGIVIISYPTTIPASITTGSVSYSVSGGNRIYTFTGSGTIRY